jgi:hypothetical protein
VKEKKMKEEEEEKKKKEADNKNVCHISVSHLIVYEKNLLQNILCCQSVS